jgi:hypothetical protein
MNLLAFVRNNPVNRPDPFGLREGKEDCIECRLKVVYSNETAKLFKSSSAVPIPAAIDRVFVPVPFLDEWVPIWEHTITRIELQARVTNDEKPCCRTASVEGRMISVKKMPELKKYSTNLEKAKSHLLDPDNFMEKPGSHDASTLLQKTVLDSIEFELKETEAAEVRPAKLNCEWKTIVADFNLGRVPTTTGAVVGEVIVDGKTARKITRVIGEY